MKASKAYLRRELGPLWNSVGKGSVTLAVATLVGGAMVYVATPLVTHVYDPAALGDYRIYLSFVAILIPIATKNYETTIALPASDSEGWSLVTSVLANLTRFSIAALATLVIVFAAGAAGVARFHVPVVLWIVPFGVFFAGGQATMLLWMVRRERYSPTVRARITQGATMAAGQPALGLATGLQSGAVGALPLASADAISTGLGFLILARRSVDGFRFRHLVGVRRDRPLLRRYRHFMTAGLPATEINTLNLQIPFLVIAATYGSTSAGQFALVERLVFTPLGVITSAITIVLIRQGALRAEDPMAVRHMFSRISAVLALCGSPLLILSALDLSSQVARLFGPQWVPAAQMLRPLTIFFFTNLVVTPWGAALATAQRQDLFLLQEVVRLVILCSSAGLVVLTRPSVTTAVLYLAAAGTASYLWYWAVCSWALRHPRPSAQPGPRLATEG